MRRLLIVGFGDVARRAMPLLRRRYRVFALVRDESGAAAARSLGAIPVRGDLDRRRSLSRAAALAQDVLHLAPPPSFPDDLDTRSRRLAVALRRAPNVAQRLVYISTSGVYGDCRGERVDETRPPAPHNSRAARRVDAERALRRFGAETGCRVSILRAPGIYAADRLPLERLRAGTPGLVAGEDSHTNHIHADDLAGVAAAALLRGRSARVYNASDDSGIGMTDWFDLVADRFGLARPPRLSRAEVEGAVSPVTWSFMRESRRLSNRRLKDELRYRFRYPTVRAGLAAIPGTSAPPAGDAGANGASGRRKL